MTVKLLAIESSCDDTSASVIIDGKVCSNIVSSQDEHALWGGVVPGGSFQSTYSFDRTCGQ